jgi:signal transduction histidine kinase
VTEVALFLALGTLAVGVALALALRLLPTVRLQLVGLALLAVVLPLGGVLASGWVMFHMHDDAKILAVSTAAALSAIVGALLLARWIQQPLDSLRAASTQFASGDLTVRAPEQGPDELVEMGADFNHMAESIERLFEARRELVAWASHDLRTPLASMQAMLEAIDDGLADPAEYLPALHDRVTLLSGLVDDLFELARIDSGVLTLHLEAAAIEGVVDSCVRSFQLEARAKGVSLETRIESPPPEVRCAPDKVERVLYNLLTNALRHTPSDGTIAVVVEPDLDTVTVAVEDSGEGIDDVTAERMFERFWRGESSRTTAGSGLGLAIARGLVEAQGGRIWTESRPGGGARVAFTLPAIAARAATA